MSKIMLVNVTHAEESRVAVVNDGVLETYEIESTNRASLKGNVHNAVVESVHPALEAAFLKIGYDLKGFLPLDEVNFKLLPARTESRKAGRIGQHLHPGQKLMVQVVREPFAGKPPSVSTYFSLPGRFLVLMPGVEAGGVSRKIEDSSQRERLKQLVDELQPPEGFGLIVRTAGMGQTKVELQRDMRYLLRLWDSIQRASRSTEFPGLVYRDADVVTRTIRDHFTPDISEVWIDNPDVHEIAAQFMRDVMPTKAKALHLYTGDRPLFNRYNLEEQIERIYLRRVPLPSGGEIVIDGTEALTAIDVNSARSRRQGDPEDSVLQTNLEAAAEIARQLRLRDLGGLVVIDFIDMSTARNNMKVEKAVRDSMKGDKARSDVTRISKLGLMEISRQRLRSEKIAASYATCPACDGHGLIKNVDAAALSALRKLQTRVARGDAARIAVGLPPEVATWMLNAKREELLRMEQRHGVRLEVAPQPTLRRHESTFEAQARERGEAPPPAPPPAALPPPPPRSAAAEPPRGGGAAEPSRAEPPRAAPAPPVATDDDAALAANGAAAGETAAGTPAAGSAGPLPAEPRSRRRRRRRRRGRGGADTQAEANGAVPVDGSRADEPDRAAAPPEGEDAEGDGGGEAEEPIGEVPRGVRADELMPAAVGALQRRQNRERGGGGGGGGRGRRRRRGARHGAPGGAQGGA